MMKEMEKIFDREREEIKDKTILNSQSLISNQLKLRLKQYISIKAYKHIDINLIFNHPKRKMIL